MEKRADGADASVLFFLLGCANFGLFTRKLDKNTKSIYLNSSTYSTVLIVQCLLQC